MISWNDGIGWDGMVYPDRLDERLSFCKAGSFYTTVRLVLGLACFSRIQNQYAVSTILMCFVYCSVRVVLPISTLSKP
jgi:hypothetical protein